MFKRGDRKLATSTNSGFKLGTGEANAEGEKPGSCRVNLFILVLSSDWYYLPNPGIFSISKPMI